MDKLESIKKSLRSKNRDYSLTVKDALTGLNSRANAKKLIEEYFMNSSVERPYALLILDINSFGKINDSLGHMFGDNVLVQVADCIIENVRKADIVGRLGGDEFIIFLKNISINGVVAQCEKIRKDIQNIYIGENLNMDVRIGGIACSNPGVSFQDLLQTADDALYEMLSNASDNGINIVSDIVSFNGEKSLSIIYDRQYIRSLEAKEKRLSEIIFELLEEAKDTDKAIQAVLALVGEKKGLARIDIYSLEENEYKRSFQWTSRACSGDGEVSFEKLASYRAASKMVYPEKGMGYLDHTMVNDTEGLILEDISTVLYSDMIEYGAVSGIISFMSKEPREWDFKDFKALKTVTRLICAYTLKGRAISVK